jgi:hypothetical protein
MNRRAIIISNPGEPGAENFCEGVNKDVTSYTRFLKTPIGGLWFDAEVIHYARPSTAEVLGAVADLARVEYSVIIFSGHGFYSTTRHTTVLELRHGEQVDATALRLRSGRQSLILDCCREKHPELPHEISFGMRVLKAAPRISPEQCRRFYDQRILECPQELVVLYACGVGQTAADLSDTGGVYSHNLITGASEWAENLEINTSTNYSILSIATAHERAATRVQRTRGDRQTPVIEKPRSEPYYPFCVVA